MKFKIGKAEKAGEFSIISEWDSVPEEKFNSELNKSLMKLIPNIKKRREKLEEVSTYLDSKRSVTIGEKVFKKASR